METITEFLPLILPLIIINYVLAIVALIHVFKHPHYRFGNQIIWIIVVFFIQFVGPILYFTVGRGEDNGDS